MAILTPPRGPIVGLVPLDTLMPKQAAGPPIPGRHAGWTADRGYLSADNWPPGLPTTEEN